VGDVGASIAASKNAVENNLLKKDPWWTEKDKKEAEERIRQGFVNKYCGGVNDASCSQKLQEKNNETLKILGNLVLDFTPVVSDIKAFDEAETAEDYIIATIGILPPAKLIKLAKKASKAGDVNLANKLIKEAEDLASSAKNKSSNFGEHVKNEQRIVGNGANRSDPIINPATNKVVTEHITVTSGKAPKNSTPNSIYEVSRADGSRSVTYYDERGNMFSREDYGQLNPHKEIKLGSDGRAEPHEHKIIYNNKGQPVGKYYRKIDKNGKPTGSWINDKKK
jgi:hypothetical protein